MTYDPNQYSQNQSLKRDIDRIMEQLRLELYAYVDAQMQSSSGSSEVSIEPWQSSEAEEESILNDMMRDATNSLMHGTSSTSDVLQQTANNVLRRTGRELGNQASDLLFDQYYESPNYAQHQWTEQLFSGLFKGQRNS